MVMTRSGELAFTRALFSPKYFHIHQNKSSSSQSSTAKNLINLIVRIDQSYVTFPELITCAPNPTYAEVGYKDTTFGTNEFR
jgi:hypothetical protein